MGLMLRLWRLEQGSDATEYALLAGLVAVAILIGVSSLGDALSNAYISISVQLNTEIAGVMENLQA